jgi:hypothetical protein
MSIAESPRLSEPKPRRDLWLSGSAAFGPVLWFGSLLGLYALAARDCPPFAQWISWAVLGLAMLGCASSMLVLLRLRKTLRAQHASLNEPERSRASFMVWSGLVLNTLTLLQLLGFGFPLLMLRPCE